MRQMKNALTILLTSRGIPMLLSGDEFANTQYGNNNAYCQDNEVAWIDWNNLEKHSDLFEYVKALISLRKSNPVLKTTSFDCSHNGTGYPELSFHSQQPWQLDMSCAALTFGYMYAQDFRKYGTGRDKFIYIAVNSHWEAHEMMLPIIPKGMRWYMEFDSFTGEYNAHKRLADRGPVKLQSRSTAVFMAL